MWDARQPNLPIYADIYVDGVKRASVLANQYRADLAAAGYGNGYHGFVWKTPTDLMGSPHTITVKYGGTSQKAGNTDRVPNLGCLTSLSPAAVQVRQAGGSTSVTITINGFAFSFASTARFDGVAKPTTFVSSSVLRMTLTYDDLKVASVHAVDVVNPSTPGATVPLVVYFADVPPGHWAYTPVNLLAYQGITGGVGNNNYGPDLNLTRAQMAVFLLKAKHGVGYTPPSCTGTGIFADVSCPSGFAVNFIEEFYREGITSGCGENPLRYCPDANVTKQEEAVFLLGSREPAGYVPPQCTGLFLDVPCPGLYKFADYVEEVSRRGIDTGCSSGNFCPTSPVSRALMAQMVTRTWGYQMPY